MEVMKYLMQEELLLEQFKDLIKFVKTRACMCSYLYIFKYYLLLVQVHI